MNNLENSRTLSPEKLGLLELLLKKKGISTQVNRGIPRRTGSGPFPLSFGQQRLWFLDQLEPGNPAYNIPAAIRLNGQLNVNALLRSLNELIRRHETLRTTFAVLDEQPAQIIHEAGPLSLPEIDLQQLSADGREATVLQLAADEARRPFNISSEPPFRAQLLRLSRNDHVILVSMHHIASDLFSRMILVREIATLYQAYDQDGRSPFVELPIQYADYALWQRQWLQGEVLERQLGYWKTQLNDAAAVLELPLDRPRAPVQSYRGASVPFTPPIELVRALRDMARAEGVTLFMLLMAVFQTLLFRYSGQTQISVGTPVAGRTRSETEGLIGFFINTLVLRTDFAGDPTFRELLRRVREVALGAFAHQDVPFEKLVEELNVERSLSHTPLFQVMLDLQTLQPNDFGLSDLTITPLAPEQPTAKFDLNFSLAETNEHLSGALEYGTELFEAETIARLLKHFEQLLREVVANPHRRISGFRLLDKAERKHLLVEWNQTATEYPQLNCLHQLIEQQVERTPEACAVISSEEQLSYRELNARANQLAHYLQTLGVGPDDVVGVLMHRGTEMVVALLGILKAGAAYLPLDPEYPQQRLSYMIEDARPRLLLTQEHLRSLFPENAAAVWCVDSEWQRAAGLSEDNPGVELELDHLAYVIYTSGSTGLPKAAMNTHGAIGNRLLWMQSAYQLTTDDRVLQKTPFSFDVSVWEFFWPLLAGAQLVMAQPGGHQDPAYLVDLIATRRITTLHFVPSMLQVFLEQAGLENCSSLRRVICSGEALPFGLQQKFHERLSAALHNLYGPTEAAVDVTAWACRREHERHIVPIGRPIANIQTYLLDEALEPTPIGVAGELYIGGIGLARGYLRRPELTAERFVPDQFSATAGARLYRTGDRARYLSDGNIEFLGRLDQQVKIRGFRIELEEIENVLSTLQGVRECVVVAQAGAGSSERRLIAYVVGDAQLDHGNARRYLEERLPPYMVPSLIIELEQMPLTPNGKIDRRALPEAEATVQERVEQQYERPRTTTEEVVAAVWAEVLRVERVGRRDNFFDLGGHSLLATQVMTRLREAFHLELPLRAIFERPTVTGLATRVDEDLRQRGGEAADLPPLVRLDREAALPLSFAQRRLWFLDQLEPNSAFYNLPAIFGISGSLDAAVLRAAVREVTRRHETLRTTFTLIDGEPFAQVHPAGAVDLPLVDLSELLPVDRETASLALVSAEVRRPFDLGRGPLTRICLYSLDREEHLIAITMHHTISDGWSVSLLIEEVITVYGALVAGRPSPLPELPIQYVDFADWQQRRLQGSALETQLHYWKQQLRGPLPVLELPADHARPAVQTFRGARHTQLFSVPLSNALRDLSRRRGATLYMTLLAAYQTLLHRYTGAEDICVGSPIAHRPLRETEQLIGCFLNTLVLRTDLSGDPTFAELLHRVRETTLEAYAHQEIPFEQLVDALQPERVMDRSPLFQATFSLLNIPALEGDALQGLTLRSIESDTGTAQFDLQLLVVDTDRELTATFVYNTDLFGAASIARMMSHFEILLADVVNTPEKKLGELELLDETEQHQLLIELNQTAAEFPRDATICQLIEEQVRRTPDATAVTFAERSLTYRELNQRANQLAHYLHAAGIRAETCVGLCVERSLEMVVGLVGILKAGGAYVPLDPAYPRARLALMLAETEAPVLLTQKHLIEDLQAEEIRVICLDADWETIAQESEADPPRWSGPEHLAYVIFTSGSTGRPKGVAVSQRNLVHSTYARFDYYAEKVSCFLLLSSFSFDSSVAGIFWTLCQGGNLCLPTEGLQMDMARLAELIERHRVSHLLCLPSLYSLLLNQTALPQKSRNDLGAGQYRNAVASGQSHGFDIAGSFHMPTIDPPAVTGSSDPIQARLLTFEAKLNQTQAGQLASLRCAIVAGEACHSDLIDLHHRLLPEAALYNEYGPTEGTVWSSAYRSNAGDEHLQMPMGRAIANTSIFLLDGQMRPVPFGVPGELYAGGEGIARGYLHRPELTAERFVPDPFRQVPGSRLYKTGDLVRYLPDGNLEFLGRADDQVKLRGYRIELVEVTSVLRQHEDVNDGVVIFREDQPGDKRLVAYVVQSTATNGSALNAGVLRRFMRERLPEYMVPSAFEFLNELPLLPNGKVNRRALAAPAQAEKEPEVAYVPPGTELEKLLTAIWSGVLKLDQIGIHDNFFDLGGHSFLAIKAHHQLVQQLQREVPLLRMFEYPTVHTLAKFLGETGPVEVIDPEQSEDWAQKRRNALRRQRAARSN
jgi:amino acid adenylation domain-containing protein